MKKIDKSMSQESTLTKLIGKFFENKASRYRVVMDITSNEPGTKLFIGISDGNKKSLLSEIEIYDLGKDDF